MRNDTMPLRFGQHSFHRNWLWNFFSPRYWFASTALSLPLTLVYILCQLIVLDCVSMQIHTHSDTTGICTSVLCTLYHAWTICRYFTPFVTSTHTSFSLSRLLTRFECFFDSFLFIVDRTPFKWKMILLIRNTISADSFNTFDIVQFRSFVNSITLVVSLSISIILHCLLSTHTRTCLAH